MFKRFLKYWKFRTYIGLWQYKYLNFVDHPVLMKKLKEVAYKFARTYNLPVMDVPFDVMNIDEPDINEYAVAQFVYHKGVAKEIITNSCDTLPKPQHYYIPSKGFVTLPRIELSEKSDGITLLHELGHFNLYLKGNDQTEELADYYIYTFIKEHLPEFFLWALQISVKVRAKVEFEFTEKESYNYYLQAKEYIKQHSDEEKV